MPISDLTGTKWVLNENLVSGLSLSELNYNINFTSGGLDFQWFRWWDPSADYDDINTYQLDYVEDSVETIYRSNGGNWVWTDEAYRTIKITGGTDATNADLIAWLEANATQQTPVQTSGGMYLGTLGISKIFMGNSEVSKIYLGDVAIYEATATPTVSYTITTTVTNGASSGDTTIDENGTATVTLSASSGYELPQSISVSGASYVYTQGTGTVSLSNPTGNVTISATCEQVSAKDAIAQFVEDGVPSGAYENDLVRIICDYAFYGCSSLTSVSFPNATGIGLSAFSACSSLTSASFPSTAVIDNNAFDSCASLNTLYVGTNRSSVCSLKGPLPETIQTIYVPSALVDDYKAAINWSSSASKIVGV